MRGGAMVLKYVSESKSDWLLVGFLGLMWLNEPIRFDLWKSTTRWLKKGEEEKGGRQREKRGGWKGRCKGVGVEWQGEEEEGEGKMIGDKRGR